MYLLVVKEGVMMKFFDNLFDINLNSDYCVTGLNRELNAIYIYEYFIKKNVTILITLFLVTVQIKIIKLYKAKDKMNIIDAQDINFFGYSIIKSSKKIFPVIAQAI